MKYLNVNVKYLHYSSLICRDNRQLWLYTQPMESGGSRIIQWQYCPLLVLILFGDFSGMILHTSDLILVVDEANQSWALQQYAALSKLSYLIWCASKPWEPALWIISSGRVINFHQWTYHYMQWQCSTTLTFDISLLAGFLMMKWWICVHSISSDVQRMTARWDEIAVAFTVFE